MSAVTEPVTLARVERALDRLAVIMTDFDDLAPTLLLLFTWLDAEAEKMRNADDVLSAIRARVRRQRDRTEAQS